MNEKINLCILANETEADHENWVKACCEYSTFVDYDIIQLTCPDWLDKLSVKKYDWLLAKPPGLSAPFKELYDERVYILMEALKYRIYPSPLEIFLYENKRFLYSWLKANRLPHPETWVFYHEEEAVKFVTDNEYPIVAKSNIGASGSGVVILRNSKAARNYIDQAFSRHGIKRRWGPNKLWINFFSRSLHYLKKPTDIQKKIHKYRTVSNDPQRGFVIFQKYILHDHEWRVVAIGDSYFAHKKLKIQDKASGSLLKSYDNPPLSLFEFVKNIMDKYKLYSQSIDLFETPRGEFLINEMQCIFGQSDKIQMKVNGIPGRYILENNQWKFEAGDFNRNESYNLRLGHILNLTFK